MKNIGLNISASYMDKGWMSSIVSITPNATDEKWFSYVSEDAQGTMSSLGVEKAYRLSVTPLGVYYSYIRKNPVCSRGSFIQISLFLPKGVQAANVYDVITCLDELSHFFDGESGLVKNFFELDTATKDKFSEIAGNAINKISTKDEPQICGSEIPDTQSRKLICRTYTDSKDLHELFGNPHQNVFAQYCSLFLVLDASNALSSVIRHTDPIQHLFTIVNGNDKYYVMEGNTIDVKLTSNPEMEPKTMKVTADGKNGDCYTVNGNTINVDEGRVDFYRKMTVRMKFPFDGAPSKKNNSYQNQNNGGGKGKKSKNDTSTGTSNQPASEHTTNNIPALPLPKVSYEGGTTEDTDIKWAEDGLVIIFTAHKGMSGLKVTSEDVEGKVSFNPAKEDAVQGTLTWKQREVTLAFVRNNEPIDFELSDTISLQSDNGQSVKVHPVNGTATVRLAVGRNYIVVLKTRKYELAKKDICLTSDNTPSVTIELKYKNASLSIDISEKNKGLLTFNADTDIVCNDDKRFGWYPISNTSGNRKLKVVEPFWKITALVATPLAVAFLVTTAILFFQYKGMENTNIDLRQQNVNLEKQLKQYSIDSTSAVTDSTMVLPADTINATDTTTIKKEILDSTKKNR